ncbi:MAG: TAT-variant-translocated molybdopterin oxidoreductase [Planctomycetales bacterium]|nr:TAT-variant-translocated molybdopterin oxidoreductase [Planctomycetales bacterium]
MSSMKQSLQGNSRRLPLLSSLETFGSQPTQSVAANRYWRSVEQLAMAPQATEMLANEFPLLAEAIARHDRRSFMRLLGASMALAGITATGCRRWPVEEIRPHTSRPSGFVPGVAEHYATIFELGGVAHGILAKSYDGRPIKIEGNPDHPSCLGAASGLAQASVLDLYDPDRSRGIRYRPTTQSAEDEQSNRATNQSQPTVDEQAMIEAYWRPAPPPISWERFEAVAGGLFRSHRARQGDGLAILVQPTSSPTEQRMMRELQQSVPKSKWFYYEPLHRDHEWAGYRAAFGRALRPQLDLKKAKYTLCINADPLGLHPNHLLHARDWAVGRDAVDNGQMNRLVCIESSWSLTGTVADTRIALKPSLCEQAVLRLASQLQLTAEPTTTGLDPAIQQQVDSLAHELMQYGSEAVLIGGPSLSPEGHQWISVINAALGNTGGALRYTEEPLSELATEDYGQSIRQLSQLLEGNVIQTLVILGGNPLYDGPADAPLNLANTTERPLVSIHLSSHDNETSQACTWHIPLAHGLETWADGRSWDGTYTLGQPLIEPLFGGKSPVEMLALISGQDGTNVRTEVRKTFDSLFSSAGNKGWEQAIHDGFQSGSSFPSVSVSQPKTPTTEFASTASRAAIDAASSPTDELEYQFIADTSVYDGRFANNAWLQELPDPISKLTWDNAAWVSPADAARWKLKLGQVIRLQDSVEVPVMIIPGQSIGCISLPLGYGRSQAGRVGNQVGSNVYPLRWASQPYTRAGIAWEKIGKTVTLASTQEHHVLPSIADFALASRLGDKGQAGLLVHETTLADYNHDHHAVHGTGHIPHPAPLYNQPSQFDTPHRWAMTVDLNKCIGCSGCVVACQAENNIPVVGRENVLSNREMHWIRIDRYFKGPVDDPDIVHVPVACAHCENAPCEQVCPVAATVHDAEGTNTMVYNRCIGTRYCANNCPYKVRRFNYFDYQASDPREPAKPWVGIPDEQQASDVSTLKKMVHNPDVTVRMRGVMEKCTYCIQRIAAARISAKNGYATGERSTDLVQDGELLTACQATCPTQAIVFGDLNDANSKVSANRRDDRAYEILAELNLGARTTYLAKIRNRPS